jgi:dolichol-phosphate mannosyltransferase
MEKKISIILCTYNEVDYIEHTISLISKTLRDVEIIIVDDNSNDGTLEKLEKLRSIFIFKLIVRKNERGLASAQKKGFEESTGQYVGTMDVNSRDQILYFSKLITKLDEGYDIAVLSRYVLGGDDQRIFIRSFASKAINLVSKFFLRISFNDFTSCIFLMKRKLLDFSGIIKTGYAEWFIEFVYIVHKKKYRLIEIPYIQKVDLNLKTSKSYPNFFTFIYLGCIYFFRILLTIIRN